MSKVEMLLSLLCSPACYFTADSYSGQQNPLESYFFSLTYAEVEKYRLESVLMLSEWDF